MLVQLALLLERLTQRAAQRFVVGPARLVGGRVGRRRQRGCFPPCWGGLMGRETSRSDLSDSRECRGGGPRCVRLVYPNHGRAMTPIM